MSSAAFTPPTSWPKGAQDIVCASEIITAYNERVTVGKYRGQSGVAILIGGFGYKIDPNYIDPEVDESDPDLVRVYAGHLGAVPVAQTDVTVTNNDYVYVKHTLAGNLTEVLVGASVPANDANYTYYSFYRFTVTDGVATIQTVIRTQDNAQSKTPWQTMQGGIKQMCDSNDLCFQDYDLFESTGHSVKFTFARLLTAAGITGGIFRRAKDYDEDGEPIFLAAEYSGDWGYIRTGDIMGPWVYEDLQACLSKMLWTSGGSMWGGGGALFYSGGTYAHGSAGLTYTYQESVDAAAAQFAVQESGNSGKPYAYSMGRKQSWAYFAGCVRASQSYSFTPSSAVIPVNHVEIWFNAYTPYYAPVFDDNGDDIQQGYHCQLMGPMIGAPTGTFYVGKIGPDHVGGSVPSPAQEPVTEFQDYCQGWRIAGPGSEECWVKWDFTNA